MTNRTWLIVVLVVSLGLNFLFIGAVIGRVMMGGPPHFSWLMQDLDDDTRRTVHQTMRQHRQQSESARRSLRAAQRDLHEKIRAEEFDKEGVSQALGKVRHASNALQEIMHNQMIETLAVLAPRDRAGVYRMLSHHRPDGSRPHRRPPRDAPDRDGERRDP